MREQVGDELVWSCSDLKSMFERLINSFNIVKYHWMMIVEDKYIEIFTIQMSFDPIGPYAAISMSDFFQLNLNCFIPKAKSGISLLLHSILSTVLAE